MAHRLLRLMIELTSGLSLAEFFGSHSLTEILHLLAASELNRFGCAAAIVIAGCAVIEILQMLDEALRRWILLLRGLAAKRGARRPGA